MIAEDNQYKCKICGYEVTFILNKDSFQMTYYEETDATRIYTAIFDKKLEITTNAAICRIILQTFRNFKKFYQYLVSFAQDQRRINISNAGYVTISYFLDAALTKRTKVKKIEFDGRKLVTKEQQKIQSKIRSEVIDVKAENAFLLQTVARLQKQYEESIKLTALLRTRLLTRKYKYLKDLKADTKQLRHQKQLCSSNIDFKQLTVSIRFLKNKISQIIQSIATTEYRPPDLQSYQINPRPDEDEDLQKYGQQHWVVIDRNNKFIEGNYRIEGDTLHKIGLYNSYQVLGRDPFPLNGKHYYSVFIDNVSYSIFSLGIANQNRRNYQHSHESSDCITYFGKNGCIWEQGICRGGGPNIPNKVQIRVVVDFDKHLIKWFQDGIQIGGTMIGQNLLQKRVVPYIQLNYPSNRVTFNRKPETMDANTN